MKLCLITPFKHLNLSKINGDMYFALTRQLRDNRQYYDFFKEQNYVIIDNNIHEGEEVDFEEHVRLAIDIGNEIIIPDVLRDKKKTLEYFHYFMDKFYNRLKQNNIKIMGVPQGNSLKEIMECFEEMNKDNRVDIIGNSFDLTPIKFEGDKYFIQSQNRFVILNEWLGKTTKPIHLLGSNGLYELYHFNKYPQIRSTDGKLFSRLSLSNVKLDSGWMKVMKPPIKMKFDDVFTKKQVELYNYNVKFFKERLNGTSF